MLLACALLLAATWGIEAGKLHRARLSEAIWAQQAERSRLEDGRIARRYHHANDVLVLLRSIDAAVGSGAGEALRLTEIARALPRRSWLTSLSGEGGSIAIEGGTSDLPELGRTIGAMGGMRHVRNATLVEAAPLLGGRGAEALRYRIRVTGDVP